MKASVSRSAFSWALKTCGAFVSKRSTIPAVTGFKVVAESGLVTVVGTNLEATGICEVDATVTEPGVAVIPAEKLLSLVDLSADQDLVLSTTDSEVRISGARTKHVIKLLPVDEYPSVDSLPKVWFGMPGATFRKLVDFTVFCAESTGNRPMLTGASVRTHGESVTFACSDSFRLAVYTADLGESIGKLDVIVPAKALKEMSRVAGDSVDFAFYSPTGQAEPSKMAVRSGRVTIVTTLIDQKFPPYENMLPKREAPLTATVSEEDLSRAFKTAAVMSPQYKVVMEVFDTGSVVVSAVGSEEGDATTTVDAEIRNSEQSRFVTALDVRYGLQGLDGQGRIALEFGKPKEPVLMKSTDDPNWVYMVMPMAN